MYLRFFLFLLGFGLIIIGLTYIIGYLNLLTLGYSFDNYIKFIFTRLECLNTLFGFILISVSTSKMNKKI